jgi:N utilization substance protein A
MMETVDENLAKSFYRSGFRTLEEIFEATERELAAVEGVGTVERATALRAEAEGAMEAYREKRVDQIVERAEGLSEREILMLCSSVTDRVADALERGGYRSITDVQRETDTDRLAVRTGLPASKAKLVKEAVDKFVAKHLERVRAAQRTAAARVPLSEA